MSFPISGRENKTEGKWFENTPRLSLIFPSRLCWQRFSQSSDTHSLPSAWDEINFLELSTLWQAYRAWGPPWDWQWSKAACHCLPSLWKSKGKSRGAVQNANISKLRPETGNFNKAQVWLSCSYIIHLEGSFSISHSSTLLTPLHRPSGPHLFLNCFLHGQIMLKSDGNTLLPWKAGMVLIKKKMLTILKSSIQITARR